MRPVRQLGRDGGMGSATARKHQTRLTLPGPTRSPPAPLRTVQALLLTEHLVKTSSQHVVQVILEAAQGGVLEGLKQFKHLDENNKDQGINVSGRGAARHGGAAWQPVS